MNQSRPIDPKLLAELTKSPVKGRTWRFWALIGGGIALLLLILWWMMGAGPEPIRYQTGKIEKGELVVRVTATGTLEPENKVDVGTEVSGTIAEVLVDFNDKVSKGQLIARIDPDQLEARVVQARANLLSAEANVKEAEATAREAKTRRDRFASLRARGNASQAELDTAEAALSRASANVDTAKAQVTVVQAQLKSAESDLAKAEIRAPIDGMVLDRKIEAGQTVAASFQTPVLFTLASDLTRMELFVDVDEADIGEVRETQTAKFQVDAFPSRKFDAKIDMVYSAPRTVNNVVTYQAVLVVPNPDLLLKPGMTATADIEVNRVTDALTVPNGALRFTPPGQNVEPLKPREDGVREGRIWTRASDGTLSSKIVIVGASDGDRTEIKAEGLTEGEEVLIDLMRASGEPEPSRGPP